MFHRIKTAWLLYKLCGRLLEAQMSFRAASIQIVVEGENSMKERARVAVANNEPPPDPRTACEVNVWADVKKPAKAHRGTTLADALHEALRG